MVLSFSRRFSAVLLALALATGPAGVCAGWMSTPEARMACCSDGNTCPMHESESRHHGSKRAVTQADADRCCAASEQDESAPSPPSLGFAVPLDLVLNATRLLIPEPQPRAEIWRASVPIPAARVPKHLLLSVFLV